MKKSELSVKVEIDSTQFYEELSKFFNRVFECEKRRLGINFKYPKLVVQVVFIVTIIALMIVLM